MSLPSLSSKIMDQILWEPALRHTEDREVVGDSPHGSIKGKWYLTKLVTFYDGVTALVGKGKATDILYLDLCQAPDIVSHNILVS